MGQMKILDARWTPQVNMLKIACTCGTEFEHRADRWNIRCPYCGQKAHIGAMRENLMERSRHGREDTA